MSSRTELGESHAQIRGVTRARMSVDTDKWRGNEMHGGGGRQGIGGGERGEVGKSKRGAGRE